MALLKGLLKGVYFFLNVSDQIQVWCCGCRNELQFWPCGGSSGGGSSRWQTKLADEIVKNGKTDVLEEVLILCLKK